MPNSKIFCSVPWHNTHLYWDGTYGICCIETQRPTQSQNIHNTSLIKWYNSDAVKHFRSRVLSDTPLPECAACYYEESHGHQSRRIKENYKVAIFPDNLFDKSFNQSAWKDQFVADTDRLPIDWHLDFGNECNLACKMCGPSASSKISAHYSKWNIDYELKPNWTNDQDSYQQLLSNVESVKKLHRIHVMGGEPTINKRFVEFVEWLIAKELTHLSLSFVTNATVINHNLLDNLQKFKRVDIEVSVESTESNNHYIRQGSDTEQVWKNIEYLNSLQKENFSLVLRSVPQLLSLNTYHKLIKRAFDLNISIQSNPLRRPSYLAIDILPYEVRQKFRQNFVTLKEFIQQNNSVNFNTLSVGRDTSRLSLQLINECDTMINFIDNQSQTDTNKLRELVAWMTRWDKVYNLNALEIYPEYQELFLQYGYTIQS